MQNDKTHDVAGDRARDLVSYVSMTLTALSALIAAIAFMLK
jgi:hypothetical protein